MVVAVMRIALLYIAVAALAALMLAPGLSGGFILDDYPNLAILSQLPDNPAWAQILALMENGIAGITGRPIAILSFLLQADAWPDNPFAFKLVNLLIHLTNGALVVYIATLLGRFDSNLRLATPLLIFLALVWLVHPIQTSTVMYVVQRMNLLSGFFVLAGVAVYLQCRLLYQRRAGKVALAGMLLAPAVAGLLAIFSKENGVLLFAYIAVLELTLLPAPVNDRPLARMRILVAFLPLALMALGLLLILPGVLPGYEQKPFTASERILSQFPVLISYLAAIVLPRLSALGLFHDSYPVYSSLFSLPVLLSMLALLAGFAAALYYRRRWPLPAFALLWFLAGHAVESTVLPLELYFEHRNYLPLLGIVLAVALGIQQLWQRLAPGGRRVTLVATVGLASLWLGFVSVQHSTLWGNPVEHAYAEVYFRPDSVRARANLVQALSNSGQADVAFDIHSQTLEAGSERIADYIRWLEFTCILPDIDRPPDQLLLQMARQAEHDYSVIGLLNNLLPAVAQGGCPAVGLATLNQLMEALLVNEHFEVSYPDLFQLRATSSAYAGNLAMAAQLAGQSYELRPNEGVGLMRMRWLIEAGANDAAAAMLETYRRDFSREIAERAGLANQIRLIEQALISGRN